ncbi:MAG: hypothetical protein IJ716_13990 [Lachnospiraceae bacterium]|nr:hypothetical protein [Lachnospiraceae bacterium]
MFRENNNMLPLGFAWDEECGLIYGNGRKSAVVANAYPVVIRRLELHDMETGQVYIATEVKFHYIFGEESEPFEIMDSELDSGKFKSKFPPQFIARPEKEKDIASIMRFLIKVQFKGADMEVEEKLRVGWNKKEDRYTFFWGDLEEKMISESTVYEAICQLGMIILKAPALIGLVLAGFHGVLKKMLEIAGVTHDFVTYVVGDSNIGKTDVAKKFIPAINRKKGVISLNSDLRSIKKELAESSDTTIVIDDYNKSHSNGLRNKNLQHASEIIYGACDAGEMLISGTTIKFKGCMPHVILTAEETINSPSTLNRCFLIEFTDPINEAIWGKTNDFAENGGFDIILRSFLAWCEENYEKVISKMRVDYAIYLSQARKNIKKDDMVLFRVQTTIAVQMVIWRIIYEFLLSFHVDNKLLDKADECVRGAIWGSGEELANRLYYLQSHKVRMEHLRAMASLLLGLGNRCYLAKTEEQYRQIGIATNKKGKICIGVCLVNGYFSYRTEWMCYFIAQEEDIDAVSENALARELTFHGLAHLDEGGKKASCVWHSKHKMHHVNVRELLELIFPEEIYDLPRQEIINKFENPDEYASW